MLSPSTEAEVAEIVRDAAGAGRPLAIVGGGSRGLGHAVTGVPLATAGLTGISLYDPGALTLVVRAGTPLAEVEAALAAENQMLPFEPWDGRVLAGASDLVPTVGGMVAVNASGPRRIAAGACRDCLIGVRFVDGTGAIVKNGGRVMKNVTGLDLVKLMAGSHGTLGVLTEVALKLLPRPQTTVTLVLEGLDTATASRAMTTALATPYAVSGAGHLPGAPSRTLFRLEGLEGSVAHRAAGLTRALAGFGAAEVSAAAGAWAALRDAAPFAGRAGAVWRVSVKPTDGPVLAGRLGGDAELVLDWGGGLATALVPEDFDLRTAMGGLPGHATLLRASDAAKARFGVFHPEPAPVAALAAGLRARFDPSGVLNPGRLAERHEAAA